MNPVKTMFRILLAGSHIEKYLFLGRTEILETSSYPYTSSLMLEGT